MNEQERQKRSRKKEVYQVLASDDREERLFDLSDCFSPDKSPNEIVEILRRLDEKLVELHDTSVWMIGLVGITEEQDFVDIRSADVTYTPGRVSEYGRIQPAGIARSEVFSDEIIPGLHIDKLLASLLLARNFDGGLAIIEYPHFIKLDGDSGINAGLIAAKSLFIMTEGSKETLKNSCAHYLGIESDRLQAIENSL